MCLLLTLSVASLLGFLAYAGNPDAVGRTTTSAAPSPHLASASQKVERADASIDHQATTISVARNATELSIDDATFEAPVGFTSAGTIYFINRLRPLSYPATLSQLQVYFASQCNLTPGAAITVLVGSNPDGDEDIDGTVFQPVVGVVRELDQFNRYDVPSLTIDSGDFVVGFGIQAQEDVFPGALDTTSPQGRSYLSTDGVHFDRLKNVDRASDGNWGIGAIVWLQAPTLTVTPSALTYTTVVGDTTPPGHQFVVSNVGSGSFDFSISNSDPSLVSISPDSATVSAGQSLVISVFVTPPTQAGTRQAFLTVNAPGAQNSPQTVVVTVNTTGPRLNVTPTLLTFNTVVGNTTPPGQAFIVSNTGSGTLTYFISNSDPSSISISPDSATLAAGQSHPISVFVTPPAQTGARADVLTVSAPGAPDGLQTVIVAVNTNPVGQPARLSLVPASLTFNTVVGDTTPPGQQLVISNAGNQPLSFSIGNSDPSLVSLSPSDGVLGPGQLIVISVFVTPPVQAGTRTAVLTITAPGVQDSPQTVLLTVNTTGPVLDVTPTSLTFDTVVGQTTPPTQAFIVSNTGSGTLNFGISISDPSLVSLSPRTGTLGAGQSFVITAVVTPPVGAGTRMAVLTVKSPNTPNAPQTVIVTVNTSP
jgi:hypothetical protein